MRKARIVMKNTSLKIKSLLLAIVVFLTLILPSCIFWEEDVDYLESKDAIIAAVDAEDNRDEKYVINYLKKWNFLPVNRTKFQGIEIVFRDYYAHAQTLPDAYSLAKSTVSLFVEYFLVDVISK